MEAGHGSVEVSLPRVLRIIDLHLEADPVVDEVPHALPVVPRVSFSLLIDVVVLREVSRHVPPHPAVKPKAVLLGVSYPQVFSDIFCTLNLTPVHLAGHVGRRHVSAARQQVHSKQAEVLLLAEMLEMRDEPVVVLPYLRDSVSVAFYFRHGVLGEVVRRSQRAREPAGAPRGFGGGHEGFAKQGAGLEERLERVGGSDKHDQ
mmetsp:Transcript_4403/g.10633  ORF Transcript_4403/g.10633 Transcript_4403/m.10633 type:complete len:203 (-) Transcript_4403:116-724(-)